MTAGSYNVSHAVLVGQSPVELILPLSAVLIVGWFLQRILRAPGHELVHGARELIRESGRVLALGAGLCLGLGLARWARDFDGVIGETVSVIYTTLVISLTMIVGLFLVRQFTAPPWWRLNAWSPNQNMTYDGTLLGIAGWIWNDAWQAIHDLKPVDRLMTLIGTPVVILALGASVGLDRVLLVVHATLLVLYVGLVIALVTANRIPRVLMSRLQEFRYVARAIASGNLNARVEPRDDGDYEEFAELVRDVNAMAHTLQHREMENQHLHAQLQEAVWTEHDRATRDPLTSLRNHGYFQDTLASELERCGRTGSQLTIAVLDLDNFKMVNDTFGHQEGDAVLIRTTQILVGNLRPYDLACRLGGEEFGVIFPETGPEDAKAILDRLAIQLLSAGPGGEALTFSAGISTFPLHARDNANLFRIADESSYAAKMGGKAQTVIYDPVRVLSMDSPAMREQKEQGERLKTAKSLADQVDARESATRNHSVMVGRYATAIARVLGFDEDTVSRIYLAGLLHDVGKIGIDENILSKAGRLTDEEFETLKQHPELSFQIVQSSGMEDVASWVRHHHEAWDGTGYPDRLRGEGIPLGARIIAVAEAFEVMTGDRSYRRAMSVKQAIAELLADSGTKFDPRVVDALAYLVASNQLEILGRTAAVGIQGGPTSALAAVDTIGLQPIEPSTWAQPPNDDELKFNNLAA